MNDTTPAYAKPDWSQQRQTEPPNFGNAELVTAEELQGEIGRRKERCEEIISRSESYGVTRNGKISIVILSCRRLAALQRLFPGLLAHLQEKETDADFECLLADNGSDKELLDFAEGCGLFDEIIHFEENLGMTGALRKVYPQLQGEYVLFLEEDFIIDPTPPFLNRLTRLFDEYPEIGIVRLKNQNNWWKPHRRIGPLRSTSDGTEFWTWLPERRWIPFQTGRYNVWAAGSVLFRRVSYMSTGELPLGPNLPRNKRQHQGYLYEYEYAKRYNARWLAAKAKGICPFFQPNDEPESPGWKEAATKRLPAEAGRFSDD